MKLPCSVKDFSDVCDFMKDVHEQKNGDYGSTWLFVQDQLGTDPIETIWSRCLDKVLRVSTLMRRHKESGGGPLVVGESMMDSILDLAVYCVIAVDEHLRQQAEAEDAEFDGDEIEFEADFSLDGGVEPMIPSSGQIAEDMAKLREFVKQVLSQPGQTVYGPASFVKTFRMTTEQPGFDEIPREVLEVQPVSKNPFKHSCTKGGAFSVIDFSEIEKHAVLYGDTLADKISDRLDGEDPEGC